MTPFDHSRRILAYAIEAFSPTHIISMVSGGKDSAASHQVAQELGVPIDFVMHGNTRCGIPETTQFVRDTYGRMGEYVEADAGGAYEDYVLRKGFFGKGHDAHGFAYRVLKATPFRAAISKHLRKGKRDVRVLLLNGARKDESENRQKRLRITRPDPASPGNLWVNLIHHWDQDARDQYLASRQTPINPVAKALCRSGECMCGTQQSKAEFAEAAALYPFWGAKMKALRAVIRGEIAMTDTQREYCLAEIGQVEDQLAVDKDMTKTAIMRQALRLYQLVDVRIQAGETMSFSGDKERIVMFVGPGIGE